MKKPDDENELIALLTGRWRYPRSVAQGVGDDCAVIRDGHRDSFLLLKTDCVVENRHFTPDAPPSVIGHKAMARVISDFAAMGGWPEHALVTVFLPENFSVARLKGIYSGLEKTARAHDMVLVGGETTRAAQFALTISATGRVERKNLVLRSKARAGDLIFVTGRLGGSGAGRHLSFTPRLRQARWLVQNCKPSAMMDLSDGLASDLPRLARASGLSFDIDLNSLPLSRGVTPHEALCDGEDYELLFTVSLKKSDKLTSLWKANFPKLALTCIGKMLSNKVPPTPLQYGFDHIRDK
ncbi:thiamine-phosphate kinase [Kamptonema cortianum]|nr:thiamine-phosphate kinase [Kamptonema cortianum]MDL5053121.1 thiamine-phosphate kinase [Oscillatoria laete-virens NRMC-F 0139]